MLIKKYKNKKKICKVPVVHAYNPGKQFVKLYLQQITEAKWTKGVAHLF
jgi:hypothetical protein